MNKDPMFNCPWLMNDPRSITTKQYIKIVDLNETVSATVGTVSATVGTVSATVGKCCPKSPSPK